MRKTVSVPKTAVSSMFVAAIAIVIAMALPATVQAQTWDIGPTTSPSAVTATLDDDGTLTIRGTGAMRNFDSSYPYHGSRGSITRVVIEDGVTSIGDRAFWDFTGLVSVTIPNSVTTIGIQAFQGCIGLLEITILDGVTTIGDYAFRNCGLTSITIPNSVTTIGNSAFENCTGLNSVTIGNSVTTIGWSAFEGCTGLTSVTIPNSVTSIGNRAFEGCTGLNSVTIGNSVTSIGNRAFRGCTGLTSVTIGNSVRTIGQDAFRGCTDLISVTIPNSVTSIGAGAFQGCVGLSEITIPDSVTSIGNSAFEGCTGLNSVTIGNSVISIGNRAFRGCTGLNSVTIGNSVTTIGNDAFSYCTDLISIIIPNSVTSIGNSAFEGCTGLNSVAIGNSVTTIGSGAFSGCIALSSITIPNNVTSIGNYAFSSCANIRTINYNAANVTNTLGTGTSHWLYNAGTTGNVTVNIGNNVTRIPNNLFNVSGTGITIANRPNILSVNFQAESKVETIGSQAFRNLTRPTEIIIPNSVTSIGWGAFAGCTQLASVSIGNSVTSIGDSTFWSTRLNSITIPNSVRTIGHSAFDNCTQLTSATIGNGVTSIGFRAFLGCTGLTSITIPNSVITIGNQAFEGCRNLTTINYNATNLTTSLGTGTNHWLYNAGRNGTVTVNIGDNVTRIPDNLFYVSTAANRPNITTINIGTTSAIQTIRNFAFRELTGLTSITIPNSVTTIGVGAYQGLTSLTSITIPQNVTAIGIDAFRGLTALDSIISLNPTPPTAETDAFLSVKPTACLYVPPSSINDYKAALIWEDFSCINPLDNMPYYIVTWHTDGGIPVPTQTIVVPPEGNIAAPAAMTKAGYTFIGWYTDSDFTTEAVFPIEDITANTTFWAKWDAMTYTIEVIGGSANPTSGTIGTSVTLTAGEAPEGKRFKEWNVVSGGVTITENVFAIGAENVVIEAVWDAMTSIASPDHIISPDDDVAVVAPITILAGEFTVGPNPVDKQSGSVAFYWNGKALSGGTLFVYDASGNVVRRIVIDGNTRADNMRRQIGTWDLSDRRGRPVSEGTYLIRGVLKTADGKRERVSAMIGIR